jgi:hypothetical protein
VKLGARVRRDYVNASIPHSVGGHTYDSTRRINRP